MTDVSQIAASSASSVRHALSRIADGLAVVVAASLPWSTSVTAILVLIWLLTVAPSLDMREVRAALASAAAALPVALCGLAVLGIAWADVPMAARLSGTEAFLRLLAIPVLIAQFHRSNMPVRTLMIAFGLSCAALMAWSWLSFMLPALTPHEKQPGNPVKDYISQSGVFALCASVLLYVSIDAWRGGRRALAAVTIAAAVLFLTNILYVSTSRTTLLVIPLLLLVLAFRRLVAWQIVTFMTVTVILAAAVWSSSSYVRWRVDAIQNDFVAMQQKDVDTSTGARLFFWKKSLEFIREAPVIGHGTGSIEATFQRGVEHGQVATATNPHNQVFHVGIQFGAAGIVLLIAMWGAHVRLFAGRDLVSWIGLCVVLQNIVSSIFNSHLSDFTQGWLYIFGVGICGGMLARRGPDARATGMR